MEHPDRRRVDVVKGGIQKVGVTEQDARDEVSH